MSEALSANCYQENKEGLQKKLVKPKEKEQQYGHERCKNLSEDEKQKLVEYTKNYYGMRKNALL